MNKAVSILLLLFIVFMFKTALGSEKTILLSPGDEFPNLVFIDELQKQDKEYLGIKIPFFSFVKKDEFLLDEIKADLLFVEFFNKYCTSCQLQAPVNNRIFEQINSDSDLRNRVKFIGVGAGNSKREVDSFKREKDIRFPLISDQDFKSYESIGDPGGTPFMLMVKKTDSGFIVYSSHMGLNKDHDFFLKEIKKALKTDVNKLVRKKKEVDLKTSERKLVLNMTEEKIAAKVKASVYNSLPKDLVIEKIVTNKLGKYDGLYLTKVYAEGKQEILYSKVLSRKPVCDVCHGIHFIVTFDNKGTIKNISLLHLTKLGNILWDEKDISTVNNKLVGRTIDETIQFDSEVDAVTAATMTTSLMYNSIKRLEPLIRELKKGIKQ